MPTASRTVTQMQRPTRIEISSDPGAIQVRLGHGALQARRVRAERPGLVRVALVAAQALLLAGDRVRIEVDVCGDVTLEVVETAGTVAYDMRGGAARWEVAIRLTDDARLTWMAEPIVVAAGAEVHRSTDVDLAPGTTATLRESVVLGRTGEAGGRLTTSTRAQYDGSPLLVEDLDLSPSARSGWATIRDHRCVDTLTTLGHRLPDHPGTFQLSGPGSFMRWLGDEQHRSPLGKPSAATG